MGDQRNYYAQRELKIYDENGREIRGKTFMTTEQYRVFCEDLLRNVKPDLDAQALARARSEDEARRHWVD